VICPWGYIGLTAAPIVASILSSPLFNTPPPVPSRLPCSFASLDHSFCEPLNQLPILGFWLSGACCGLGAQLLVGSVAWIRLATGNSWQTWQICASLLYTQTLCLGRGNVSWQHRQWQRQRQRQRQKQIDIICDVGASTFSCSCT